MCEIISLLRFCRCWRCSRKETVVFLIH